MKEFSAIILAAGKGTRMKSALPKPLHKIAHKPILGYAVETYKAAGALEIVIVVAPDDMLTPMLFPDLTIVVQKEQKGTAHAALTGMQGLKKIPEKIIMAVGDMPFIRQETVHSLAASNDAVTVLAMRLEDPRRYGRLVVDNDGALKKIVEFKEATLEERGINLCNSGTIALKGHMAHALLSAVKPQAIGGEYYNTDVVAIARAQNHICGVVEASMFETSAANTREELAVLETMLQVQLRQKIMLGGVTLHDPQSVYFASDTVIGQDVIIEPNVFFGPGVTIGNNVHVKAFSHIEGATISDNVEIGPFARIRPETTIEENARIGNFVEIKKSQIGKGAKVSHLSYIGDATLGQNVNIGAGTITCNYDGFNKNKTTIGNGAFIGSNSSLVAPVVIGDNAMVAAGSVITKLVTPEALALARGRQTEILFWAKNFRERNLKKKGK
ncbi:MAG: UDP-N-acetylglucosamine diphosphorylase/glucosamine-phosphate N-acetyltransferase [Alphaproteobacteria bacterium]|nr:UDP-N-acetylglucosamine diphosphorylase/glucosamine-phosphate N-acetyltransferase [Alphaproteobacteria bacterium]